LDLSNAFDTLDHDLILRQFSGVKVMIGSVLGLPDSS